MTNEQIEQDVRKVIGKDASPRKVQALVQAVERFGPEWLKNYQQRQQRQPATGQQRTSRQRSTLDWTEVEAWVKRQPQTSENWVVGGYYTACPVPTHKTDDLISIWAGKDGGLGLKCWGSCGYGDIHKALANVIKSTPKPNLKARVEELTAEEADLEKRLDAVESARDWERAARNAAETDVQELQVENTGLEKRLAVASKARHEVTQNHQELQAKNSSLAQRLTAAKGQVRQEAQKRADVEKQLAAANDERERERAAGVAAETRVPKLQTEQSSLAKSLTAAEGQARQETQERAARIAAETRAQKLEDEKSSLEKQRDAAETERDQARAARKKAEAERDQERTARIDIATQSRVRELQERALHQKNNLLNGQRSGSGPLADARRLLDGKETIYTTYAFIDAVSVLELDLRRALEQKIVLDDDGLQCMLMNASNIKLISEEQRSRLDGMRRRRNQVLHHRRQLKMPEARDALDFLGQVIGQLGS